MQILIDFGEYEPWSGAVRTVDRIIEEFGEEKGMLRLEQVLEELFCEKTPTATEVNDLLWFEPELVYASLGMSSEDDEEEEEDEEEEKEEDDAS